MTVFDFYQDLVGQVPELVQPLVVALAGAVPFIEGEGAATIGIIGGINPVVAGIAAAVGNFLAVAVVVILTSGARQAVVTRTRARAAATVGGGGSVSDERMAELEADMATSAGSSKRRAKFERAFERYGVPGVSLLGPLLLPTHFTASMLTASGVRKSLVLVWQAAAIILWTTLFTVIASGLIGVVS
ncbi:small multidrug efflux protein [Microcella flavibacter]|uniref:small multidrug efflux protein n=1 Tax=Microcella flavibacter TaxID=1804990 RepID=UPI00145772EA|nr:small multidrug efflux protein [Microcella flavibacter]